MDFVIVSTNKWTDRRTVFPVIYATRDEADKKVASMDKKNETHKVHELKP